LKELGQQVVATYARSSPIMNVASFRSPLDRRAIETINEGRLDDFLALFARSATVVDGAMLRPPSVRSARKKTPTL
jgi:hypothetical protein